MSHLLLNYVNEIFSDNNAIIAVVNNLITSGVANFYEHDIWDFVHWWEKCMANSCNYVKNSIL